MERRHIMSSVSKPVWVMLLLLLHLIYDISDSFRLRSIPSVITLTPHSSMCHRNNKGALLLPHSSLSKWRLQSAYKRDNIEGAVQEIKGSSPEEIIKTIQAEYGIDPTTFRRAFKKKSFKQHRFKRPIENYTFPTIEEQDAMYGKATNEEEQLEHDLWAYYGRTRPNPNNRLIYKKNRTAFSISEDIEPEITDPVILEEKRKNFERVRALLDEYKTKPRLGIRHKRMEKLQVKAEAARNRTLVIKAKEAAEAEAEMKANGGFRLRKPPPEPTLNLNRKVDRMLLHQLVNAKRLRNRALQRIENAFQPVVLRKLEGNNFTISSPMRNASGVNSSDVISTTTATTTTVATNMAIYNANASIFSDRSFFELGITDTQLMSNLYGMDILSPTKIQGIVLPALLNPTGTGASSASSTGTSSSTSSAARYGTTPVQQYQHQPQPHMTAVIQSNTGSGKTLAYLLPLLSRIDVNSSKIQALVLAPSRELVLQIHSVAEALFADTGIRSVPLIGGANIDHQIDLLRERKPQVIIATPGRLAEIALSKEKIRLSHVRSLVIDEADNLMEDAFRGDIQALMQACTPLRNRTNPVPEPVVNASPAARVLVDRMREEQSAGAGMYDFFIPDNLDISLSSIGEDVDGQLDDIVEISDETEKILKQSKKSESISHRSHASASSSTSEAATTSTTSTTSVSFANSTLVALVSATALSNPHVQNFADTASMHSGDWMTLSVNSSELLPRNIYHGLVSSRRYEAIDALHHILTAKPEVERALIFVNQPKNVDFVCERLYRLGFVAAPLHGEASKLDRKEALDRFRDGRIRYVVATELASRGLDVPDVSHVINFDVPTDSQHYLHRAGRCGRAGRDGLVISIASPDTKHVVRRFGKQLGVRIKDVEYRSNRIHLKEYDRKTRPPMQTRKQAEAALKEASGGASSSSGDGSGDNGNIYDRDEQQQATRGGSGSSGGANNAKTRKVRKELKRAYHKHEKQSSRNTKQKGKK